MGYALVVAFYVGTATPNFPLDNDGNKLAAVFQTKEECETAATELEKKINSPVECFKLVQAHKADAE